MLLEHLFNKTKRTNYIWQQHILGSNHRFSTKFYVGLIQIGGGGWVCHRVKQAHSVGKVHCVGPCQAARPSGGATCTPLPARSLQTSLRGVTEGLDPLGSYFDSMAGVLPTLIKSSSDGQARQHGTSRNRCHWPLWRCTLPQGSLIAG